MSITPKQQRFVDEYLIDLNGAQAAIRAGYSAKTAKAQANRLLANVHVERYLRSQKASRSVRLQISQDDVVRELANVAMVDIAQVVSWDGANLTVPAFEAMPAEARRAIQSIKVNRRRRSGDEDWETETVEVKLHNKVQALEVLRRHLAPEGQAPGEGPSLNIYMGDDRRTLQIAGLTPDEVRALAATVLPGEESYD